MQNQKELWNAVAARWHAYRTKPDDFVRAFIKKQRGKLLDLGSGSGRYLLKQDAIHYTLVDFSEAMINLAKNKAKQKNISAEFFVTEMHHLPFEDETFDSALCLAALHCVQTLAKRKKTLCELYRVLKRGAQALISVWNKDTKRFKNSPKERFVGWEELGKRFYYLYCPQELYRELEAAGFRLVEKRAPGKEIFVIVEKPK